MNLSFVLFCPFLPVSYPFGTRLPSFFYLFAIHPSPILSWFSAQVLTDINTVLQTVLQTVQGHKGNLTQGPVLLTRRTFLGSNAGLC